MDNSSEKPPFSAIFDFSFTEFISIDLIRLLYVFAFLVAGIAMITTIMMGFLNGILWGIGSIILSPVVFFLIVFSARISLETMIVIFRIAENTKETAEHTKTE